MNDIIAVPLLMTCHP